MADALDRSAELALVDDAVESKRQAAGAGIILCPLASCRRFADRPCAMSRLWVVGWLACDGVDARPTVATAARVSRIREGGARKARPGGTVYLSPCGHGACRHVRVSCAGDLVVLSHDLGPQDGDEGRSVGPSGPIIADWLREAALAVAAGLPLVALQAQGY